MADSVGVPADALLAGIPKDQRTMLIVHLTEINPDVVHTVSEWADLLMMRGVCVGGGAAPDWLAALVAEVDRLGARVAQAEQETEEKSRGLRLAMDDRTRYLEAFNDAQAKLFAVERIATNAQAEVQRLREALRNPELPQIAGALRRDGEVNRAVGKAYPDTLELQSDTQFRAAEILESLFSMGAAPDATEPR